MNALPLQEKEAGLNAAPVDPPEQFQQRPTMFNDDVQPEARLRIYTVILFRG